MGLFGFSKYKTLSHAVRAGDVRAARKMLNQGADPNRCDADDDAYPIHYGVNHGPEMVQLLVDHGADVNNPSQRNHAMPLAFAESQGYSDVAAILRKAGAQLRTGAEELCLDPRIRLQIEPKIEMLVPIARVNFPMETPEAIADRVEGKLNFDFPSNMSPNDQERIRRDVRALIKKECGVKDYLKGTERPIPSPEDVMAKTGLSEHELTRRFMEHLIQAGNDPFAEMSGEMLRKAEEEFSDLAQLARRKFGAKK